MNLNHISSFCVKKFTFSGRKQTQDLRATQLWVFPGAPVIKNPLSNLGDTDLIPGQGTKIPQTEEQLSSCAATKT